MEILSVELRARIGVKNRTASGVFPVALTLVLLLSSSIYTMGVDLAALNEYLADKTFIEG